MLPVASSPLRMAAAPAGCDLSGELAFHTAVGALLRVSTIVPMTSQGPFFLCGDFINDHEGISGYEVYRGDLAIMYLVNLDTDRSAMCLARNWWQVKCSAAANAVKAAGQSASAGSLSCRRAPSCYPSAAMARIRTRRGLPAAGRG